MRKKAKVIYTFLLSLSIIFSGCMQRQLNLLLHIKKGDSYRLEIDKNEKVVYDIKGEKTELESKMKTAYLCHVTSVDDNKNAELTVTFDTINIRNNNANNGQTLINNSPTMVRDTDKLSQVYSALIGKSFKVKVGEYGKVKQIIGMDELFKEILDELNITDKQEREEIKKDMKQNFGDKELTTRIGRITSFYPNTQVRIEDTWKKTVDISDRFPVESENEYKLRDSSDGTAEIEVKGKVRSKEGTDPIFMDNIKITYEDIDGTESGTISVNEESGLIRRAEMQSKYSGKIKYTSSDPNMGTQAFPISVEEKTMVNVLRQ